MQLGSLEVDSVGTEHRGRYVSVGTGHRAGYASVGTEQRARDLDDE